MEEGGDRVFLWMPVSRSVCENLWEGRMPVMVEIA